MIIERVQVDGGFLDGLDLHLLPGLNVIIGGRGTGKTSVIELIRFCLAVPAQTTDTERGAIEHALSVLGDGRVTVTFSTNGERTTVSRAASEDSPDASDSFDLPALFSQKEIESLGLSAPARIRLLDSFISDIDGTSKDHLAKQIGSSTVEIAALSKDIEALDQQLQQLPVVEKELAVLTEEERVVAKSSKEAAKQQANLQTLGQQSTQYAVQLGLFQRASRSLSTWHLELEDLVRSTPDIEVWPDSAGTEDKLMNLRKVIARALEALAEIRAGLAGATADLHNQTTLAQKGKVDLDDKVRALRKELEGIEKGAGETIKRANALREKLASLRATLKLRDARATKLESVRKVRANFVDQYEEAHRRRFLLRQKVAVSLNASLGPEIKMEVRQAAEYADYVSVITSALRGSGLRYNELAPLIAGSLSPRELVEAVERQDHDFVVSAAGIPRDRAARFLASLKDARLESILTVTVDDDAILQLLDGKDYKDVQHLSVGQRCTVVLPIVLEHRDRVLIVDQPEDHLDNSFIVQTLIKALRQENRPGQMLFSTHNANIPVLGDAQRVFVMKSTGERGYIDVFGPLDDHQIVQAISTVMEGGKEAFDTRAKFYRKHELS